MSGKRKIFIWSFTAAILFLISFAAGMTSGHAGVITAGKTPDAEEQREQAQLITKLTGRIFSSQHYRRQPLNEDMSSQIFDTYFRTLDPGKMYFTAGDISKFEHKRRQLAQDIEDGNNEFAFAVYDVFKKRFDQYHAFAREAVRKPFDFTLDEEYTPDRRHMPYPADEKELQKLWMQKLKSDVLYFRLFKRSLDENSKKSEEDEEARKISALWDLKTPQEKVLTRLKDLQNFYSQREKIDILSMFLNAVAAVYGPHSGYMAPKTDEDFEIGMSLSLSGIGATLTSDNGYIRVVDIVPGGPAALDGRLQPEDRIIAVAQENAAPVDVIDMSVDNAVKLIRGPVDTKVTLSILPGKKGRNAIPENITLTRAKVLLKDSEASGKVIETDLGGKRVKAGIISLPSFYMDFEAAFRNEPDYKSCTRDVADIIDGFKKEGVDTIVMDLRGNGGGSLPEAIAMTGLFIKTGPVVQVRIANQKIEVEGDDDSFTAWDGPLVVLVNKMSASASEIFTGAIKDYRRGVVVGDTRTFGKGTVLSVLHLENMLRYINRDFPAGSMRLESAMFFRINGSSVQQRGVEPDIVLPSPTEYLEIGEVFSDNHLPWAAIKPQSFRQYDALMPLKIMELKTASAKRIAEDAGYIALQKRLERLKKQTGRKTVSLNEEKRWREYINEKELIDAEEETVQAKTKRKKNKEDDAVLNEAVNIAADLALIKL